jgi:transcription initiation factor TFIIIB Brf1 subunit/transcription initiation factor TFIIB
MAGGKQWQVALLAGAMTLGMAWTAQAQENTDAQQAAQQDGQQGRRGRGQGGPGGARNPAQAVEQLQSSVMALDLKDEQKTQLQAIFKDAGEKAKAVATEVESLQGRERGQRVNAFRQELREKVDGVLNDEQKQTLRKNMVTQQAKQSTDRYRRVLGELGLSDDQKTKVEAILADSEKKMIEAAPQAGQGGGQGGGRGGAFGEIARETREKINDVLTVDQQGKFEEAMSQRGGQGRGRRGGQQN